MVQTDTVTEPTEALQEYDWLTDAVDAEVGMRAIFDEGGSTIETVVGGIEFDDGSMLLHLELNSDEYATIPVSEVNDREDVVVV